MKDYIIEVKDGHHHVRMLTDEELKMARTIERVWKDVLKFVTEVVESVRNVVRELVKNIDFEKLKEYEDDKHSTEQIGRTIFTDTTGEIGHSDAGTVGD